MWHVSDHPVVILAKFGQNPSKYVAAVANLRVAAARRKKKKLVMQRITNKTPRNDV